MQDQVEIPPLSSSWTLNHLTYVFQIILMSATINCRQFAEYFGTPVRGKMNPAYVFEVEGAPYAIEEFYLDDLHKLFPYRVRRWWMFADAILLCPEAK